MSIANLIDAAKSVLAERRRKHDREDAELLNEVEILERHVLLKARVAEARLAGDNFEKCMKERCELDPLPNIAAQVDNEPTRLDFLLGNLAAFYTLQSIRPRLVVEYRKFHLDGQVQALADFETENAAILKRHGAI